MPHPEAVYAKWLHPDHTRGNAPGPKNSDSLGEWAGEGCTPVGSFFVVRLTRAAGPRKSLANLLVSLGLPSDTLSSDSPRLYSNATGTRRYG